MIFRVSVSIRARPWDLSSPTDYTNLHRTEDIYIPCIRVNPCLSVGSIFSHWLHWSTLNQGCLFIQKYAICDGYKNIQKYFNENLVAMLNYSLSYECWSNLPSLMQAWIRTIIPSLFVCFAANRHQRLIMFFELFIVLRSLSVQWIFGFASLCKHNSTNPLRVLSKTQPVAVIGWIYLQ